MDGNPPARLLQSFQVQDLPGVGGLKEWLDIRVQILHQKQEACTKTETLMLILVQQNQQDR